MAGKKTNLMLHHQDCRNPCSFAMLSFCGQSHICVPEASNSVANSSVCCFGSECLVRNRIALCMGKSENGIAVFAVLRREEFQNSGKQQLQNNRRLPCATCTYEQTCALLPFVHGHLPDLFVKCDIEGMSEPFANGPLPVNQLEAPSIWIGIIRRGFKFLNPCSKTCRWQFDMLPLCLWIRRFSVNPTAISVSTRWVSTASF